jgi:hypothetical protein
MFPASVANYVSIKRHFDILKNLWYNIYIKYKRRVIYMMKDFLRDAIKDGMAADEIRAILSLVEEEVQAEADIRAEAKRARIAAAKEGLISAYACYLTEADIMTEAEVAKIDWKKFDTMLDEMAENVKAISKMMDSVKVVKVDKEPDILSILAKMGI